MCVTRLQDHPEQQFNLVVYYNMTEGYCVFGGNIYGENS